MGIVYKRDARILGPFVLGCALTALSQMGTSARTWARDRSVCKVVLPGSWVPGSSIESLRDPSSESANSGADTWVAPRGRGAIYRRYGPCATVLRLRGAAGESKGPDGNSGLQTRCGTCTVPGRCDCGDPTCPHAPDVSESHDEAQRRVQQETLKDYVRRIEQGERLSAADLPPDIVQDLSLACTDGRLGALLTETTPWWLFHPFGNVSSVTPPERPIRTAAEGDVVEETRAELTHNGGRSTSRGWRATGAHNAANGDSWGLLWAQDAEQVKSEKKRAGLACSRLQCRSRCGMPSADDDDNMCMLAHARVHPLVVDACVQARVHTFAKETPACVLDHCLPACRMLACLRACRRSS